MAHGLYMYLSTRLKNTEIKSSIIYNNANLVLKITMHSSKK